MIIQCHGHYDLLHLGHVRHLKEARKLRVHAWDLVIVSLTAGAFMSKFGHPIFSDGERVEMLKSLRCVDEVIIVEDSGPYKAIDLVKPDIYVKGKEYEGRLPEQKYCEDRGIKVVFIGEKIFGSTRLKSLLPSS